MTYQKMQNISTDLQSESHSREAYGGRLRQGILPFLLNEFVYSPFSMIKSQPNLVDHRDPNDEIIVQFDRSRSLQGDSQSTNLENHHPSPVLSQVFPVKRGPGRPRKEAKEMVIAACTKKVHEHAPRIEQGNHELMLPIKRKPGRPPSVNKFTQNRNYHDILPEKITNPLPIKRKRGRPPKSVFTETGKHLNPPNRGVPTISSTSKEYTSVRRGPGRPPRNPTVNDQTTYSRPQVQLKNRPTTPFKVRVEALSNDADRKSMVEIFKKWFPRIKVGLFREFIQPQQNQSTRRRQTFNGPFHWLIRNVGSNEILCAASGIIHSRQFCHSFMEILYFATTASHLNLGLGRLLNAALQNFAYNADCEYVLVQASREAVAFWTRPGIGYTSISRELMAKFKHFYEMRSIQLSDTVLLTWKVDEPSQKVIDAKKKLSPLVQLEGDI